MSDNVKTVPTPNYSGYPNNPPKTQNTPIRGTKLATKGKTYNGKIF